MIYFFDLYVKKFFGLFFPKSFLATTKSMLKRQNIYDMSCSYSRIYFLYKRVLLLLWLRLGRLFLLLLSLICLHNYWCMLCFHASFVSFNIIYGVCCKNNQQKQSMHFICSLCCVLLGLLYVYKLHRGRWCLAKRICITMIKALQTVFIIIIITKVIKGETLYFVIFCLNIKLNIF